MKDDRILPDHFIGFFEEENFESRITSVVSPVLHACRNTGYVESDKDTRIFYEYYLNPAEKAAIVISHGFCEFTAKYEEVIYYFYQAGYSVFILDYRGHGYSTRVVGDRCKVHVHSYEEYIRDLHSFVTQIVRKKSSQRKLVLYAHSMGGAIAALYLEKYPETFTCAILSSPMLQMDCGKTPTPLVWLAMYYKKLTRSDQEYVSGHKAFDGLPVFETSSCLSKARYNYIFLKRLRDQNYQTYGATCAWTLASLKAVRKLQKKAQLVRTPVLLFQAGLDTTVKPEGQRRFSAASKNTQLVLVEASKHEIYNAETHVIRDYYQKIFHFIEEN